ncbi:hypothetical protein QSI_3739 [Clostridioides difficile P28]|nr:hypothetical protein QSI_3739 [Clostridioides difficile P28]
MSFLLNSIMYCFSPYVPAYRKGKENGQLHHPFLSISPSAV